jgi:hypothetical protein
MEMDAWKDIVKTILIGSAVNAELPQSVCKELNAIGLPCPDVEHGLEAALLETAAVYTLLRQAGLNVDAELKQLPYEPSPVDKLEVCSPKASSCLAQILQNNQDEVLVEWLEKMTTLQKRAPEELLPDLLSFAAMHERLRDSILAVLGERGRWLAQFNKRWSFAGLPTNSEDAEDQYHLGNLKERLFYIQDLRKTEAQEALDLLESSWETEDYQTKTEFIKVLEEELSEKDVAFLENALADRRKEVRQEAARLLACIPSSNLVKGFEQMLEELIQFDPKTKTLKVELPSKIDKHLKRDGIREHYKPLPEGKKANWLAQMIAMVPPTYWEKSWDLTAEECLEVATNDDYRNLWWWGWGTAAKRLNDEDWLLAMHRYIIDYKPSGKKSLHFSLDFLYNNLSNSLFNQLAWEYLEKDANSLIGDDHPAMLLLLQEHQNWEDQLALEVIERIRKAIANDAGVFNWNQKTLLKRAAFAVNPLLYEKLENNWPEELGYSWQSEVHNFLATLRFRREILNLEG